MDWYKRAPLTKCLGGVGGIRKLFSLKMLDGNGIKKHL